MLLIDLGNTALKAAMVVDGQPRPLFRQAHDGGALDDALTALSTRLPPAESVLLASVLSDTRTAGVIAALTDAWGCPVTRVTTQADAFGVRIAYQDPTRLGVDRWLAMLGARHAHAGDLLIADVGTALTVDVLRADGRHLGGVIVPGFDAMLTGLATRTELSPSDLPMSSAPALGADTGDAIANGGLLALAGAIDGVARIAREQYAMSPKLLLTGGDARAIASATDAPAEVIDDLVLSGLAIIAKGW